MEKKVKPLGNFYGFNGGSFDGLTFDRKWTCPTLRSSACHGSAPYTVCLVERTKPYRCKHKKEPDRNNMIHQLLREKRTIVIGQMDNTKDHTFESANRVYAKIASCPTIPTCGGGGLQPKVIRQWISR